MPIALVEKAKEEKKLNRWRERFLEEESLPPLVYKNGERVDKYGIRFLLYKSSLVKEPKAQDEVISFIDGLDKTKSNDFAQALLEGYLANGAKSPKKYILTLCGRLGDDNLIQPLKESFTNFIKKNRLGTAINVIDTMSAIGSIKALREIDFMTKSRQKPSVLRGAHNALILESKSRGITLYELLDMLIPDFGFEGLYKEIDVNGEVFRVFVANDFKLYYMNEENKIRKSVPTKADKRVKEELKSIQKELRDTNKSQVERLEKYMIIQRVWSVKNWEKWYLHNPLMFIYASSLVWGVYNAKDELLSTFYVDEDASLLDMQEDEVELHEDDSIKIMHPLCLDKSQLRHWSEHFYDAEVIQPFLQLQRPTFEIEEDEKEQTAIMRYKEQKPTMAMGTLIRLLEKMGWERMVVDGGYYDYNKYFIEAKLSLHLGLYGIGAFFDDCEFVEVEGMEFHTLRGYQKVKLKDVPRVLFSEAIYDMDRVMEH